MALMIGRRCGQHVRVGRTTITVTAVDVRHGEVTVTVRPGGAHTFTGPFERLALTSERAKVQARPHPRREHQDAAQLRIAAPTSVRILRVENGA
jgi:sRNA-binding carbon storage regulator CsrA